METNLEQAIREIVRDELAKIHVTRAIGKSIPTEKPFSPFLASDLIPKVDKTWDTFEGHQPIV